MRTRTSQRPGCARVSWLVGRGACVLMREGMQSIFSECVFCSRGRDRNTPRLRDPHVPRPTARHDGCCFGGRGHRVLVHWGLQWISNGRSIASRRGESTTRQRHLLLACTLVSVWLSPLPTRRVSAQSAGEGGGLTI